MKLAIPALLSLLAAPAVSADGIDPALLCAPAPAPAATAPPTKPAEAEAAHVDLVFCIDRSGSMGDVIETAKRKVWAIVNETAKAKPTPVLRIGLVGYGDGERVMHRLDLTDDLDEVYRQLMTYRDDSPTGAEFVGHAIQVAAQEMKWSQAKRSLKVIYVVGNETARQGPPELDYAKTAPAAIAKGIMVNAVYCGEYDRGSAPPTWREFAKLADGQYLEIAGDGGRAVAAVATPFDAEIAALNGRLNQTYVSYGPAGRGGAEKQAAQDTAALSLAPAVLAERAAAKAKPQYSNSTWDLVDASKRADFDLKQVKDEDLPEVVRKLEPKERAGFIERKARERADVQKSINELSAKRDAYVEAETAKAAAATGAAAATQPADSFDAAVRESLREQGESKGFTFEK